MNEEKCKETLNYLYKLEFFSPFTPAGDKIYDSEKSNKIEKTTSTIRDNQENKKEYNYIYYIGDFEYKDALTKIRKLTNDPYNETTGNMKSCICGLKVNDKKEYLPNTFSICRFIYAIHKILKLNKVDLTFDDEEIIKTEKEIECKISKYPIIDKAIILEIFAIVMKYFPCIKETCTPHIQIYQERKKKNEEIEEGPTILSSFYLEDLKAIKTKPSKKIQNFLSLNAKNKIEIDKDIEEMKKIVSPKNYPLGKWPSIYHPSLMQQIAINLFTHANLPTDIFSVNGPPGSGKTTLIKEIIASIIVKRAIKICDYNHPDEAFTKEEIKDNQNKSYQYFFKVDPDLAKYSILIASNNNKAVENISLELPKAASLKEKNTMTSLFDIKKQEEIYFTSLVNNENFSEENWGLISARLGNKKNIQEFISTIWFDKNSSKVKFNQFKENNQIDFSSCKETFLKKLKEVESYQNFLEKVQNKVFLLEEKKEEYKNINNKKKELNNILKLVQSKLTKVTAQIGQYTKNCEKYETLIKEMKQQMPWYKKIIFFLLTHDTIYLKIKEIKQKIKKEIAGIFDLKLETIVMEEQVQKQKEKVKLIEETERKMEEEIQILEKEIDKFTNQEKICIADKKFYENISFNRKSQESCPWTNKTFDTLREELFFCALQLQKAFILNANSFNKNLYLLINVWNNSCDSIVRKQAYKDLLSTIFLFVPVISTTLASVQKFLADIKEDELEYLIIDEAGQATPSSVIGVINRFKKTILLGDPFQIEPVTTTPKELYRILDKDKKISSIFHDDTLSAQILADYQNSYGTNKEDTWIGCPLIIHRRCIEPMFSIANQIAYNNKMICATIDNNSSKNLSMKKSCWINCSGEEYVKDNHFIKEQAEKLLELLQVAINKNNNQLPNIYIITPFKTVAQTNKEFLKKEFAKMHLNNSKEEIKLWLDNNCGTIHTFQGKEADEVIITLGCDKKNKKAVTWASKKPNILNVAVSRAKYRITIIGDKDLWNVPYFNTAYYLLEKDKSH